MSTNRRVLMVSKPLAPPWSDSGKNLVRDLALHGSRYTYRLLTTEGHAAAAKSSARLEWEAHYKDAGRFAPALSQNVRTLLRLLRRNDTDIRHFFFAPNPRTSAAARLARTIRPGPTVQTVMSTPRADLSLRPLIFADRVVALSEYSRERLVDAGIPDRKVAHIPPGIEIPDEASLPDKTELRRRLRLGRHPVVLYAGDYEFSSAATTLADAIPLTLAKTAATFVFACRRKTPAAGENEQRVRQSLQASRCGDRVRFEGELPDIHSFISACDLCVLPAESLYAKMDLPLVLLEAMARYVPVVVSDVGPINEIVRGGGGLAVPPRNPQALSDTLVSLLSTPGRLPTLAAEARKASLQYDIHELAARQEALYDELLESRS